MPATTTRPALRAALAAVVRLLPGIVLAAVVCLHPRPAGAQGVTATIEGRVLDATGLPVAGVTIGAVNSATGFKRLTATDDGGRYLLIGLPVEGTYEIRAEGPGFAIDVREGLTLRPDQALVVDFTLRVAARDTIAVGATTVLIDRSHATLQQTLNEDLIDALPIAGRGFMPLVSLVGGITGHPDFPNPHGQMFWSNNVLVDRASHFSKWRSAARSFSSGVPLEAVRQVQVLTALFAAEFGEGLASVTSVTTKAGTNDWRGSAHLFARSAALDAPPVFAVRKPPGHGQQFGVSLGGPLVPNQSHVFGAYESRRARDRNIVVSPAAPNVEVPDELDEQLLFLRIDHQQGGRLFVGRYNAEIFSWHHEPGGLALPPAGTEFRTRVHTLLVTGGIPLSARTLHDLRFQFSRYVHRRADTAPGVFVSRAGYSMQGGELGPAGFGADPEHTWEATETLVHVRGAHTYRMGGGMKYVLARSTGVPSGWGAYYFAGAPDAVAEPYLFVQSLPPGGPPLVAEPHSLAFFGFAQTDWTVHPVVRLNLGLRYDLERVSNVRGFDVPLDLDNLQPRLGITWDVTGEGRTVVRGGTGLYTQQHLLYPISRVQLEGPEGTVLLNLTPGSPLFPRFPSSITSLPPTGLAPRDIQRAADDLRNPYSIQAAAGIQHELSGGVLAVDYVYLQGRDLISLVDANAPASIVKPASRTAAQADATRPLVPVPDGFRKLITLGNEGRSWYHALEVKFERGAGPLHVIAAYTRARAEDMANYELPEDSRNLQAERARSSAHVPHSLSTGFAWILPGTAPIVSGWSLAGIGTFRGNRPYTIFWGDDRNGTTQHDARPGDRNTGKTDMYGTVDLAVTKRFGWRGVNVDARVQAFNAFNRANYDQYVGELVSPRFGSPVSAFPPRRVELAAIVRF
jgi:hypothetical protein